MVQPDRQSRSAGNGLTLHPDKARIGDSAQPSQGFDFLGYRFEAGRRHVRNKSLMAFKDKERRRRDVAEAIAWDGSLPT